MFTQELIVVAEQLKQSKPFMIDDFIVLRNTRVNLMPSFV